MKYPACQFKITDGPLEGLEYLIPDNQRSIVMDKGFTISIFRRVKTEKNQKGYQVPIAGKYAISFDEEKKTFSAAHIPNPDFDIYFKTPEEPVNAG